jgi:hypothetical protein
VEFEVLSGAINGYLKPEVQDRFKLALVINDVARDGSNRTRIFPFFPFLLASLYLLCLFLESYDYMRLALMC